MSEQIIAKEFRGDSMVCYCHRQSTKDLISVFENEKTLEGVQRITRAGTACGGCRIILESMFGQPSIEIAKLNAEGPAGTTACVKPGVRIMKSLIIANEQLESTVVSSNAVPPQLLDCDSTTAVEYALADSEGKILWKRNKVIRTNETFVFSTQEEADLPRPFHGMFFYSLGRSNYGASRFNVIWSSKRSITSTHENATTGRPRFVLPLLVDPKFLKGANSIYLGMQNPHGKALNVILQIFEVESDRKVDQVLSIPSHGTRWIDANRMLYAPAMQQLGKGSFALRVFTPELDTHCAPTLYFFIYNRTLETWSANHM